MQSMHSSEGVKLFPVYIPLMGTLGQFHTHILCTISSNPLQMFLSRFTYLYRPFCHSLFMSSFDCFGSARPRGLTFTWWGCAVYAFDINQPSSPTPFFFILFLGIYCCLYGLFNCICMLCIPTVHTTTYGQRAFSHTAPTVWNNLSKAIQNSELCSFFEIRPKN